MADERHGLAACVYVDGVKFENASGWSLGISGEECEVVEFEDVWKQLLRGVLAGMGSITAYHDQEAKILAELAQSTTTKEILLYPDCTDDSTFYQFSAWFDFEHTADVGACQQQTSPFRVDGEVSKVGWECMLLKDSFSVAEGAPMATPHVCMPGPGQLVLDQTDGNMSVVTGEFLWPVQAAGPVWGAQDWHALTDAGAAYTRALGQVLKFRVAVTTADEVWFGYDPTTTPTDELSSEHCIRALAASAGLDCHAGASSSPTLKDIWPALAGYAQIAIVLSPFDASGMHYYPGTALTSAYGAHYYFRDETETYPHHRLAWYFSTESTASIYPAYSNQDSAGKMDYVCIPCATYETPLLVPIAMDLFAGTERLNAPHDMDYGGWVYVEHVGTWNVASGVVSPDATADAVATYPCLTPDIWHEADVFIPTASAAPIGLAIRKSADTANGENEWHLTIQGNTVGNDTFIDQVLDGTVTPQVAASNDWADDTTYKLKVRAYDEEITVYINDAEVAHYASAWFNKCATWHGIYADDDAAATFDELLTLPVGSGLARECFDSFTAAENLNIHVTDEGALTWVIDAGVWASGVVGEADPDGTADARCHVVTGVSNAWVTARALIPAADEWVGALVRGSADSMGGGNYWYCEITDTGDTDQQIVEVRDGAHTVRASADIDIAAAARYYIQVRCRDNDIRMWVDGADELGYASAGFNNTATWHGLYSDDSTDAKFDQFRVTTINTYGEYDVTLNDIS